jgi:3-hydroxyacyl-CoA dehydrogenase
VSQPSPSEQLGIAGSGAIACGLAEVAGEALLWARSERSAQRARSRLPAEVTVTTELESLGACSLVVEAVTEELAVKAGLFAELGPVLGDETLLATTTSSLPVDELARASGRADRFAALHVFNPVHKMQLVEVAFPPEATPRTRARTLALCESLGKTAIEVPSQPGFVVNRLLFPYLLSAVALIDETGMEPAAIDDCMKLGAGHPLGPLAVLDFVGLDVAVAIGDSIGAEVPERLRAMVAAGDLGRKSGAGFYAYG